MNTINKYKQMWKSLRDPEYRKQLIDEHINVGIAFQIRSLRERQKLTQTKLAELMGDNNKQPMISEWEDPNYGKYTLTTLKDLAKAFDVGLLVRFVPFSTLINWTIDLTSDVIAPPNFGEEEQFHVTALASATSYPVCTKDGDVYDEFVRLVLQEPVPSVASTVTTAKEPEYA